MTAASALKITVIKPDDTRTTLELMNEFKALSMQDNLTAEKQKLDIIHAFEKIIKKALPPQYRLAESLKPDADFPMDPTVRDALYYFMFAFGLFESVAGSYLSGAALFSLIPGISNPALMISSLVFTILSSVLFYAFEVTFLKEALGISSINTDFTEKVKTYSSQLNTTIAINRLLATIHVQDMNTALYDEYVQLTGLLNQDLRNKLANMGQYPESLLKNVLKIGVLAFGALSSIAGSYFFANSLMAMVAASWVGTPIGWTVVILTVIAGLGFYYAMDATSMIRLVNPAFDTYATLKQDLERFEAVYGNDLNDVRLTKNRFVEKKPMQDCGTQTDYSFFKSDNIQGADWIDCDYKKLPG